VSKRILLLIDEINRGDISRIFGELITYIEPDKRNQPIMLAQSPGEPFVIPENLSVLGTMNTADKSISLLDIALRRRFAFLEFPPLPAFFTTEENVISSADGVDLGALLAGLNRALRNEGIDIDRAIGHALLAIDAEVADPVQALRRRFEFDIHPLIVEYCYTDRARVARILGALVDDEGRFRSSSTMARQDFLQALRVIAGQPALADELTETEPEVLATDTPQAPLLS
jgi:5-methylcytosine-specific restriction protein B